LQQPLIRATDAAVIAATNALFIRIACVSIYSVSNSAKIHLRTVYKLDLSQMKNKRRSLTLTPHSTPVEDEC